MKKVYWHYQRAKAKAIFCFAFGSDSEIIIAIIIYLYILCTSGLDLDKKSLYKVFSTPQPIRFSLPILSLLFHRLMVFDTHWSSLKKVHRIYAMLVSLSHKMHFDTKKKEALSL